MHCDVHSLPYAHKVFRNFQKFYVLLKILELLFVSSVMVKSHLCETALYQYTLVFNIVVEFGLFLIQNKVIPKYHFSVCPVNTSRAWVRYIRILKSA